MVPVHVIDIVPEEKIHKQPFSFILASGMGTWTNRSNEDINRCPQKW
jgi:hypothetical protein